MSIQMAREFCARIQEDTEFAARLKAANTEAEVAALTHGAGLDFTMDELEQVLKEGLSVPAAARELSEAEAEAVAGGMIGGVGDKCKVSMGLEGDSSRLGGFSIGGIVDQVSRLGLNPRTFK
jgi:predicted ribosomally synthesized peptide with nif11-like leader